MPPPNYTLAAAVRVILKHSAFLPVLLSPHGGHKIAGVAPCTRTSDASGKAESRTVDARRPPFRAAGALRRTWAASPPRRSYSACRTLSPRTPWTLRRPYPPSCGPSSTAGVLRQGRSCRPFLGGFRKCQRSARRNTVKTHAGLQRGETDDKKW